MKDIKCFDYTTDKTKRKLMWKMINKLEEKDKEIERLNNIINVLEDRIDKAIEKVCILKEHYFKEKVWGSNLDFDELLDILRGEDSEPKKSN